MTDTCATKELARNLRERREYTRGYNRGVARMRDHAASAIRIAKGYRARLQGAETDRRCDKCSRWRRAEDRTLWGYCDGSFEWSAGEGKMWADTFKGEKPRHVITHENFGCVNWLPAAGEDGK